MNNSLSFHDDRPTDEWWFALQPGISDEARLVAIEQAARRYESRFGCPPVGIPRVIMVGKTPVLAYAAPVARAIAPPRSVIIEASTEAEQEYIMQLSLL